MKLVSFKIGNYRSINDSGDVKTPKLTTLVGRNESGKTNLLTALHSLNPAGGRKNLSPIKDFPRHRRLSECTDETEVVHSTWELLPEEQNKLAAVFPRAKGVTHITVCRFYRAEPLSIEFLDLKPIEFSLDEVTTRVGKIVAVLHTAADKVEETHSTAIERRGRCRSNHADNSGRSECLGKLGRARAREPAPRYICGRR